jgi:hypothetical protein
VAGKGLLQKQGLAKGMNALVYQLGNCSPEDKALKDDMQIRWGVQTNVMENTFAKPMIFEKGSDSLLMGMFDMTKMGLASVSGKTCAALSKHLEANQGTLTNMAKLVPKGKDMDSWKAVGEWLPTGLQELLGKQSKLELFSWAPPTIYMSQMFGVRHGMAMPAWGAGFAWKMLQGKGLLVSVDMKKVADAGSVAEDLTAMLDGMAAGDALKFMMASMVVKTCCEGDAGWVPWGWAAIFVGLSKTPAAMLHLPWMSKQLVAATPQEALQAVCNAHAAATTHDVAAGGPALAQWLG